MGNKNDSENPYFGYSRFRPKILQWLANFWPFLTILSLNAFLQGAVVNGLVSTSISSIEKRFKLTSTQSGIFAAFYDVFVTVMLLPLALYAGKVNKVFCIGLGMLFVAFGSLTIVIPEYLAGAYKVGEVKQDVCVLNSEIGNRTCPADSDAISNYINPSFALLLLSQAFVGIGASPLFTYGFTCIDEFDAHVNTGRNMGIYMAASTIGPAIAFIGGGYALKFWGDFARTNPQSMGIENNADPRWVGFWWIGFLLCGFVAILTAIPLILFPRKLRDTDKRKSNDVHRTDISLNKDFSDKKYEFFQIFWMFLRNPTVMCLILMQTAEALLMNGYITFVPKLMETLFGYSSSQASALTGALVVPVGVIGSLVGGKLSKMFKNKFKPSMYTVIVFSIGAAICSSSLLLRCEELNILDINVDSTMLSNKGISDTCNKGCSCNEFFNPVCAVESQITFFSPCHAGCLADENQKLGVSSWTHCGCSNSSEQAVKKGYCKTSCGSTLYIFFTLFVIMAFCIFVTTPVMQSASVRVVHHNHRDHFMCFGWLWMRILGSIPGAIIFGAIIDQNCLYWQKDCSGKKCQYYDSQSLGQAFFIFTVCVKIFCSVLLTIATKTYKEPKNSSTVASNRTIATECSESVKMSYEKTLPPGMPATTMVY